RVLFRSDYSENFLHDCQIVPAPDFLADLSQPPAILEPLRFVQGDRRGIASLDARNQHMHLALARFLHKLGQKGASDAAAAGIARHIDRKFGGMAEALERAKRAIA